MIIRITGTFLLLLAIGGSAYAEKMRIAIMDFQAKDVSASTANTVSELIRTEIINTGKYIVVERSQMGEVLKEQGLMQAGCTDISCAVEVGKLLSAKKILIGNLMKLGTTIIINGRIVDVEKGVAEFGEQQNVKSEDELINAVVIFTRNLTRRIAGMETSGGSATEKRTKPGTSGLIQNESPDFFVSVYGSYLMPQGKFSDVAEPGYGGGLSAGFRNLFFTNSVVSINTGYYMLKPAQDWIDSVKVIQASAHVGYTILSGGWFIVTPSLGFGYLVHMISHDPLAKYAGGSYSFTSDIYYDPMAAARLELGIVFSSNVQLVLSPSYIYFFEKSGRYGIIGGDAGIRFSF